MQSISDGDIVRLKIGGPDMAVVAVVHDYVLSDEAITAAFCISEIANLLYEQVYPLHVLDLVAVQGGYSFFAAGSG